MLHKAWNSKGEMPYCFPRSSIKFQGHTVQNITDFDPNWAFTDYWRVTAFKSLRFALFQLNMLCWTVGYMKHWLLCVSFPLSPPFMHGHDMKHHLWILWMYSWHLSPIWCFLLAATKQLYEWFSQSVHLHVCHTFLPEAIFGLGVLLLPACVCLCVHQSQACLRNNSSTV